MNKNEFLAKIKKGISRLSKSEKDHYIQFYSEMIDDRIEDGMSEEEAVNAIGTAEEIVSEILRDKPIYVSKTKIAVQNTCDKIRDFIVKKVGLKRFYIILAVVLCFPIIAALFGIFVGIAASVISIFIALYATAFGLFGSFVGMTAKGVYLWIQTPESFENPLFNIGTGIVCAGLGVLVFILANYSLKQFIRLVKYLYAKITAYIKTKKEASVRK